MSKSTTWYQIKQIYLNINTINLSTLRTLFSIQRFLFNVIQLFNFNVAICLKWTTTNRLNKNHVASLSTLSDFQIKSRTKSFQDQQAKIRVNKLGLSWPLVTARDLGGVKLNIPDYKRRGNVHCRLLRKIVCKMADEDNIGRCVRDELEL